MNKVNKKGLYTIGIIALVLIAVLFVGCSSPNQVAPQTTPVNTQVATSTPPVVNTATTGADLTLVTQNDTDIGTMI